MMKRSSFSYKMRQSLSDITNSQSREELNLHKIEPEPNEHVNRLMKVSILSFVSLNSLNFDFIFSSLTEFDSTGECSIG